MQGKKLFIVTNRKLVKSGNIYDAIQRSVSAGADVVILREKDLSTKELLPMANRIKNITDFYGIPLIINGNLEVALEINAYGYHVGYEKCLQESNDKLKLGLSIHSIDEALSAQSMGAEYILAGNIFATDCKRGLNGKGLNFVTNLSRQASLPVIAIGGININNASAVISSGARGVAVMSLSMEDTDGSLIKNLKSIVSSLVPHFASICG